MNFEISAKAAGHYGLVAAKLCRNPLFCGRFLASDEEFPKFGAGPLCV
jgi:hypothetical protein